MEKIKRLQVAGEIYKFADYDLTEFLTDPNNYDKIVKVDENGNLTIENTGVAECNGVYYQTLPEAFAAVTEGTITLKKDVVLDNYLMLVQGKKVTLDFNNHIITPTPTLKLTTGLIDVDFGATLTLTGKGGIYAGKNIYTAVGVNVGTGTGACNLIINDGYYEGAYYGVASNGSQTNNTSSITINGGTFRTLDMTDSTALYNPAYNSTLTITGGDFTGGAACEIRAGKANISGGTFTALAPFRIGPNGNGSTSVGAALVVAQHTSKQPINLTVSGGLFSGVYAFYEGNPQKNEQAALDQVTLALNAGCYVGKIYSEDKTAFVNAAKCKLTDTLDESYKA